MFLNVTFSTDNIRKTFLKRRLIQSKPKTQIWKWANDLNRLNGVQDTPHPNMAPWHIE